MPPEIWEQQCEAALQIRDDYGWWKAVGYLVGEKFLNALRPRSPLSEDALNEFAARIREVIPRGELESYFKNVSRVGVWIGLRADWVTRQSEGHAMAIA